MIQTDKTPNQWDYVVCIFIVCSFTLLLFPSIPTLIYSGGIVAVMGVMMVGFIGFVIGSFVRSYIKFKQYKIDEIVAMTMLIGYSVFYGIIQMVYVVQTHAFNDTAFFGATAVIGVTFVYFLWKTYRKPK